MTNPHFDNLTTAFAIIALTADCRHDDARLLIDEHPDPRGLAFALAQAGPMTALHLLPSRPLPDGLVVREGAQSDIADAARSLALEFAGACAEDDA